MGIEDSIRLAEELKWNLTQAEEATDGMNHEIQMWRSRYLASLPQEQSVEQAAFVWTVFRATPCKQMWKNGPEKIIEDARNGYDENERRIPPPSTA